MQQTNTDQPGDVDHKFQISLLDNGVDFILKGIDELFEDDEFIFGGEASTSTLSMRNYKYGILNLFAGFLLLLKERLHRHMPELIFTGKLRDIRAKLKNGNEPSTVTLDEALERLEIGPRFIFSDEDLETIRCMQSIRNVFEHHKGEFNKYQLSSALARFLAVVDRFLVDKLAVRLEEATNERHLVDKIHGIESVWKRLREENKKAWSERILKKQPEFEANREQILRDFDATLYETKGAYSAFMACPECYQDTLITDGDYAGICTNEKCGYTAQLTECARCDETTVGSPFDSFSLCESCVAWITEAE